MVLFSVFIISDRFINSFFGKIYAQITPSNLLNILMYFDFKIDQPFSNYQAQKVKFPKFTLISLDAPIRIESETKKLF